MFWCAFDERERERERERELSVNNVFLVYQRRNVYIFFSNIRLEF